MAIPDFDDKYRLVDIRKNSLNPVIKIVNELDPRVRGLQAVVALAMTDPVVNVNDKTITFKKGGSADETLDLSPMFDSIQHGISVSGNSGPVTSDVNRITFKNMTVNETSKGVVEVTAPVITGQVGLTNARTVNRLNVTGNTDGSSLDAGGTLTLNMPNNSVGAWVNGASSTRVDKIHVNDTSGNSTVGGDTLQIKIPDPINGLLQGSVQKPIKSLTFNGPVGTSSDTDGNFVVQLPSMSGEVHTDPGEEFIKGIKILGNVGNSKIVSEILEIDLPTGGGGGSTVNPLKVGVPGSLVPDVSEIHFSDSEVKVDITTRSSNKVLITHKGTPTKLDDGVTPSNFKYVKQVSIKGDVEGSSISDTGVLELLIPKHAGLTVSDGKATTSAGVTSVRFPNSTVTTDSSGSTPVTVVTMDGISGQMDGDADFKAVEKIKLKGTLGGSSISNGLLTIDLPAGGGGGTGSTIYGVVGSETAVIDRVEVIGAKYNSSVNAGNKTLKVDIPNKPTIRGGGQQFSDIDIVEVANSTVTLSDESGKRRAFIVPHIPYMFEGWFQDISALNNYIPEAGRIPTKTCGYVFDHVTNQNVLMMWMPDYSGGFQWEAIEGAGSLTLMEGGAKIGHVDSITRNAMTLVDSGGRMTIKDTTIPEVVCETLDDASNPVQKGVFNQLQFVDGEGSVDFEPNLKTLKILRAQRRIKMGNDPDTTASQFTDDKYEGSIFLNKDDHSWWGFANKDHSKKWTKVIHSGMSDEVSDLYSRLPPKIHNIESTNPGDDDLLWSKSGWTHMYKDNESLPSEVKGKMGGFIQTFVYKDTDTNLDDRTQVIHLDEDASSYKRYFKNAERKWSDWVKISFNPLELKAHNEDIHAHRVSHPYYKTITIDFTYQELKDANYYLPIKAMHFLGASDGRHLVNEDQIAKVAYDGKYRIRGHLYFRGTSSTALDKDKGVWKLYLAKRAKGTSNWEHIKEVEYQHNTTSYPYPPLRWDITDISLKSGDDLTIGMRFDPATGTEASWLATQPGIGFYGLRSFISVDEMGNDGGFALGETHRKLHGRYVAIGNYGLKVFRDIGGSTTRVVDDTINTFSTEMK